MAEINPTWPTNGEKPWGNKLRNGLNEIVDAVNDRPTFEEANAAYLTPDIEVERSATGAVVAVVQNGEPTTYTRDATGAIIAYTRDGITHTITRTATGAIEGISA